MWPKRLPTVTAKKCKERLSLDFTSDSSDFLNCGNVVRTDGGLRSTQRFEQLDFPVDVIKVIAECNNRLYVLGVDGFYSYHDGRTYRLIPQVYETGCGCIYRETLIFAGPPKCGAYAVKGDSVSWQAVLPAISMTVCNDRMFALEQDSRVAITAMGQIGFIDFETMVPAETFGALVTLGKKVYCLGDSCCVFEPQNVEDIDVTFRSICQGVGEVQTDTQAAFGRKAIFATDCGLRLLQSDNVTPIFPELNDFVSFKGSVACSHKGLYYVSCKRKDSLQEQNDITLIIDVHNQKIVGILDMGLEKLYSSGETLYAVKDGKMLKMRDNAEDCYYSKTVDFGSTAIKFLDSFLIKNKNDVVVTITGDNAAFTYNVKGKNTIQRLPITGAGRTFTVKIQAQDDFHVDYAEITARSYEV